MKGSRSFNSTSLRQPVGGLRLAPNDRQKDPHSCGLLHTGAETQAIPMLQSEPECLILVVS